MYVGAEAEPVAPCRDAAAAQRLAGEYSYLVQRLVERLSARLPQQLDQQALHQRGFAALRHAAATADSEDTFPVQAVGEIQQGLQHWIGATEWYRQTVRGRAQPLLRTWRGLLLAGREATDQALCGKLRLSLEQLSERFLEFATVFTLEPKAFLPPGTDVKYSMAETIAGLQTEQQLALALYFHQELTFSEIAKAMGLQPERAQELFGRGAAAVCVEAGLGSWPGRMLLA